MCSGAGPSELKVIIRAFRDMCIWGSVVAPLCTGYLLMVLSSSVLYAQDLETATGPHLQTHSEHTHHSAIDTSTGISFQASLISDSWANARGGNYRGVGSMGNLNLMLELDTEKLGWWREGRFVLYGIGVYGRRASLAVGDYQFSSNIDGVDTLEPYEAFYEHHFGDGLGNFLLGIHDFTTEFSVLSYGNNLLNSSFSTPSTITQIPYSFYPNTGLGARTFFKVSDHLYNLFGIYDGRPASQRRARSIHLGVNHNDGAYFISEVGRRSLEHEKHSKIAIGAWYSTGEFSQLEGGSKRGNQGSYLVAEKRIWSSCSSQGRGVGVFAQAAHAQSDRNFNPLYFGAGINLQAPSATRTKDVFSVAWNVAKNTSLYRESQLDSRTSERVVEVNYRAPLSEHVTVTPDIQFIMNPGTSGAVDDSLLFYLRVEVLG